MIINLAVRRSLFKHKGLMAAVFILFTIAISLLSLSAYTFDSLEESYIVFDEQRNAEDFRLIAGPFAEAAINDELILEIEEQYNVELEKKEKIRFTAETENVYDINLYEETDELNKQILVEGEYPSKKGDIVLSSQYAELEEIAIGDTYTIDDIDYNVSGIAFFAEYTLPIDLAVGVVQLDPLTYIPLYMHKDSFVDYENTTFYYAALNHSGESNFSIGFDIIENNTIQVPKFDIYGNSIPGDDGLPIMVEEWIFMMSIPAEFNPGITAIEDEIVMDRAVMSTTATGIVILTIILTIILFDTIFQKQKREMGIIKAEGVQATKLAHTFLKYFILILFVGSALGVTIGVMGSGPLTDALLQFYTIPLLNNSREFLATTIGLIAIILFI
ncbi:MAG: ABC transporter permease, partial [Spiroplasma sp.]|nr:ABC transporter permease [Mycoplasmatales bacterium]